MLSIHFNFVNFYVCYISLFVKKKIKNKEKEKNIQKFWYILIFFVLFLSILSRLVHYGIQTKEKYLFYKMSFNDKSCTLKILN